MEKLIEEGKRDSSQNSASLFPFAVVVGLMVFFVTSAEPGGLSGVQGFFVGFFAVILLFLLFVTMGVIEEAIGDLTTFQTNFPRNRVLAYDSMKLAAEEIKLDYEFAQLAAKLENLHEIRHVILKRNVELGLASDFVAEQRINELVAELAAKMAALNAPGKVSVTPQEGEKK